MNSKIIIVVVFCALSIAYARPSVVEKEKEKEKEKVLVKREIPSFSQEELADVSAPTLRHTRAVPDFSQEELADVSAPTLRHTRAIPTFSQEELADVSAPTHTIRHKRATCDLLSGLGVNHSACAAHCIAIGRKGGYCNGQAVCVCRN